MDKYFSFISDYAGHILTVIFGVAAVWFYDPKDIIPRIWSKIIKVVATLLGILVIIICYRNFSTAPEGGPLEATVAKQEESSSISTTDTTEDVAVNAAMTKELPKNAYAIIEASSTYDGDLASHIATNLIDKNLNTNWTEGVQGNGEGEYVDFTFRTEQSVAGFIISAGNHVSNEYYTKNSRPKTIVLTFSDGTTQEFTLLDEKEEQEIYFEKVVHTKSIRLTISSVYSGSTWNDTVISEITFLVQE